MVKFLVEKEKTLVSYSVPIPLEPKLYYDVRPTKLRTPRYKLAKYMIYNSKED